MKRKRAHDSQVGFDWSTDGQTAHKTADADAPVRVVQDAVSVAAAWGAVAGEPETLLLKQVSDEPVLLAAGPQQGTTGRIWTWGHCQACRDPACECVAATKADPACWRWWAEISQAGMDKAKEQGRTWEPKWLSIMEAEYKRHEACKAACIGRAEFLERVRG